MELLIKTPQNYYRTHNATIVGEVRIGELCNFWFGSVVRGDVAPVTLGRRVNVQDGVIVHCETGKENVIEDDVSIGHRAVVHGSRIGRGTLIGMTATVLGGTVIGRECIIAAGAVVPPGMEVPDGSVVMGVPGKIVRPVSEAELKYMRWIPGRYVDLAEQYLAGKFKSL